MRHLLTFLLILSFHFSFSQKTSGKTIFQLLNIKDYNCPLLTFEEHQLETVAGESAFSVGGYDNEEVQIKTLEEIQQEFNTYEQNFIEQGKIEKPTVLKQQYTFSNGNYLFKQNNLYGLKNSKGVEILKPIFEHIRKDANNGFSAYMNGQCNYYNTEGIKLIDKNYYSISKSGNDLFIVQTKQGYGVINAKGERIVSPDYKQITPFTSFNKNYFRLYTTYRDSYIVSESGRDTLWKNLIYEAPSEFTTDVWIELGELYNLKTKKKLICNYDYYIEPLSIKNKTIRVQDRERNAYYLCKVDGMLVSELAFSGIRYIDHSNLYIAAIIDPLTSTNRIGILDVNGKWKVQPKYEDIKILYDSLFIVKKPGGLTGIINSRNQTIFPFKYTDIDDSNIKNYILCTNENKTVDLVNILNKKVQKENINARSLYQASNLKNKTYIVTNTNFHEYLTDQNFHRLSKNYERVFPINQNTFEGMNTLHTPDGMHAGYICSYFDQTGKPIHFTIHGEKYDSVYSAKFITKDLKHVQIENDKGYFIYQDQQFTNASYHWQSIEDANLNNYFTTMAFGGKHGLINKKGEFIIPPVFEYISSFDSLTGIAKYNYDNKRLGYITSDGKFLFGLTYEESEAIDFNLFIVKNNGRCGVVTKENINIIPLNYSSIELKGGIVYATQDSITELFDIKGNRIK